LAANFGWDLNQFDVKNAFLHGDLKEEVYMEIPPGYEKGATDHTLCRLKKELYELKQSPRAWFGKFAKVIVKLGYKQSQKRSYSIRQALDFRGRHGSLSLCG
jgi:hypothetical protein